MRNIPEVKQNSYDIFTPHLHSAGAHTESMKIVSFTYPLLTSTMVRSTLFYFWIVHTPPHQNLSYTSLNRLFWESFGEPRLPRLNFPLAQAKLTCRFLHVLHARSFVRFFLANYPKHTKPTMHAIYPIVQELVILKFLCNFSAHRQ